MDIKNIILGTFKYDVAYENNSDKFNNGHCRIKVKVTGGLQKFPIYRNTNCQVQYSTWVQARKLILGLYVPWWLSCLDRGALNNVDSPGCGTSVVRGPTGHK